MTINSLITDSKTGKTAKVVMGGAIAVTDLHPSLSFNALLGVDDTPVNIVPAKADHVFCMTG